jgi:phage tail-like protein
MADPMRVPPLFALNFDVDFIEVKLPQNGKGEGAQDLGPVTVCSGSFSEITGLEATMEPKVIKQGGQNFGELQRVGPVTFSTVVLKRGVTNVRDLFRWFELVGGGMYAKRLTAKIHLRDAKRREKHVFVLERALPVKFKAADFNAQASAVAIEELHIVYEALSLDPPNGGALAGAPGETGALSPTEGLA